MFVRAVNKASSVVVPFTDGDCIFNEVSVFGRLLIGKFSIEVQKFEGFQAL